MASVTQPPADRVLITDDALALIGVEGPLRTMPYGLSHDEIRRFSQAAMEVDPIHWSVEAAQARGYPDIVAPPLYPLHALKREPGSDDPLDEAYSNSDWDGIDLVEDGLPPLRLPVGGLLNGGVSATIHDLALPGDVISSQARYYDLTERSGRSGPMVFVVVETTYRSARGLLLRTHTTMIARPEKP